MIGWINCGGNCGQQENDEDGKGGLIIAKQRWLDELIVVETVDNKKTMIGWINCGGNCGQQENDEDGKGG